MLPLHYPVIAGKSYANAPRPARFGMIPDGSPNSLILMSQGSETIVKSFEFRTPDFLERLMALALRRHWLPAGAFASIQKNGLVFPLPYRYSLTMRFR